MKNKPLRDLIFAALCVGLGLALPQALHAVPGAGQLLLPMHVPVLLCGLLCGWQWGFAAGVVTPILSSLIFSMPPVAYLPGMVTELAIYGLAAGFLYRHCRWNINLSLVLAMLAGRVAYGLLNTLLMLTGGEAYALQIFFTGLFVTGLPGIVLQLVLLPLLVLAIEKSGLVPAPQLRAKKR